MGKMWEGRFSKQLNKLADDFNSSIAVDSVMYRQDIKGSMAHAAMLGAKGIIAKESAERIIDALGDILSDIESGKLIIDYTAEDIHMFIEGELTARIGDDGKRLHTARSRNDQVAVDVRLYLRDESENVLKLIDELIEAILEQAKANKKSVMPGYTHLQRAQPIVFAHQLLAYGMMLKRDYTRIVDAVKRMNECPLGACALAGTTYPIDRFATSKQLGFDKPTENSIDSVSDRDFCIELLGCFATLMMHLSRFSEEIILWSSWEFKFVELDDSFTTGSSIMPQKKNSDMAELVRGKTGRVYGDLMALLTMLKGLPLAYNKDMQEDKEAVFDALETVKLCLSVFAPMVKTMKANPDNMLIAAQKGFINATDLADYLTKNGIPFRAAYKTVGQIVGYCIENGLVLESLPLSKYQEFEPTFKEDLFDAISLTKCVETRISYGATGNNSVETQIAFLESFLKH